MEMSVIFSTYNSEEWLEKVIIGFSVQTFKKFEIIIADDGSRNTTKELIDNLKSKIDIPIIHVWHPDNGFQKSQILNKAILAANSEYLVFTDGDCIPKNNFLEQHNLYRKKGHFLSGGYFKLPMDISKSITNDDIISQKCFDLNWLKSKGLKSSFKNLKFTNSKWFSNFMNTVTPTNASWNGHNASGWKADLVAINGFDERMQYGGQDRELGERLVNFGIKPIQIRYSALCLHLDHPRGYATKESIVKNKNIRKETRTSNKKWTDFGIVK